MIRATRSLALCNGLMLSGMNRPKGMMDWGIPMIDKWFFSRRPIMRIGGNGIFRKISSIHLANTLMFSFSILSKDSIVAEYEDKLHPKHQEKPNARPSTYQQDSRNGKEGKENGERTFKEKIFQFLSYIMLFAVVHFMLTSTVYTYFTVKNIEKISINLDLRLQNLESRLIALTFQVDRLAGLVVGIAMTFILYIIVLLVRPR